MKTGWLRWAGSKWRSLHALKPIIKTFQFDRFVDPFVGAGSIFFELADPVSAILSDTNRDLISFYNHLRSNPVGLYELLTQFPAHVTGASYVATRRRFNALPYSLERAATFLFLNRTCFNGVYRVNKMGQFNVPIGRSRFEYPSFATITLLSKKLQRAEILEGDFAATARFARRGSLFYIDPPYTETNSGSGFNRYGWPPFRKSDLYRLESFIAEIVRQGAEVIVSYSGSQRPWFVTSEFALKRFRIFRSISSNGSRGHKAEVCAYLAQPIMLTSVRSSVSQSDEQI